MPSSGTMIGNDDDARTFPYLWIPVLVEPSSHLIDPGDVRHVGLLDETEDRQIEEEVHEKPSRCWMRMCPADYHIVLVVDVAETFLETFYDLQVLKHISKVVSSGSWVWGPSQLTKSKLRHRELFVYLYISLQIYMWSVNRPDGYVELCSL